MGELLGDEDRRLYTCVYCRGLFTSRQLVAMRCPKAEVCIDFHGKTVAQHMACTNWDISRYVKYCHDGLQLSWREIYWRLWGTAQLLYCSVCHQHFRGTEFEHCLYHPEKPIWNAPPRAHLGAYPCCKLQALRFGAPPQSTGCESRDHTV